MTPELLSNYLKVLRDSGAIQVGMELEGGFKLSVGFAPQEPSMTGRTPTPGGWKGETVGLDDSMLLPEPRPVD